MHSINLHSGSEMTSASNDCSIAGGTPPLEITVDQVELTAAARSIGIASLEMLTDYLGMSVQGPVTVELIACVVSQLPVTFDRAFNVG